MRAHEASVADFSGADRHSNVPAEIQSLSDLDLVNASRVLSRGNGNQLWLLVPLIAAATWFSFGAWIAVLCCIATIAICRLAILLYERSSAVRRAQQAKQEFNARFHIDSRARDEEEAQSRLARYPGTDTILLFRAWRLPHGGHQFLGLDLGDKPRLVVRATPFLGDLHRLPGRHLRMSKLSLPLTETQSSALRELVTQVTSERGAAAPPAVVDGMPCELVVVQRGTEPICASMNFAGLTGKTAQTPAARLIGRILEIEADVVGHDESQPIAF